MSKQFHCKVRVATMQEVGCCCQDNHYDLASTLNRIVFGSNENERKLSCIGSSDSPADKAMLNDFPRTCQDLQFFLKYGNNILCPTFLAYFADD
ncbi:hypothetical protein D918_04217 [Trichuris suis]|nr:hypothetical protein D918_04217 [Trichuris suis]